METDKIIDSYKSNFKSPLGAYVYMLLNQHTPEFFVISSQGNNKLSSQLENILLNAEDFNSLIKELKSIPKDLFNSLQEQNKENNLSKENILKLVGNLKYANIDWNSKDSWSELNGFIEYNRYSPYIKNKEELQQKLKEHVEKFSLSSLSVNPNFNPDEFLEKFEKGVKSMCEVLNISPKQIGLNALNLNYKTEEGDFTGYVGYDKKNTPGNSSVRNKMVINKAEVFAHEWMHFIEGSLGIRDYSFTELMDNANIKLLKNVLPEYNKLFEFKEIINQKEQTYSEHNLSNSLKSAANFFERYAIDSNNFYSNIEKISLQFEKNYKKSKDREKSLELFEMSVSELLQKPHPTRYFSFLKAQCDLYINKIDNQSLEENQFMDFAKKSDEHLQLDDYTQSTVETFARSFETFLYDKLKSSKKDCIIVGSSYDSDLYPQSGMREKLNDAWEDMWSQIKNGIDSAMPTNTNVELKKSFLLNNIETLRSKFSADNSKKSNHKIR